MSNITYVRFWDKEKHIVFENVKQQKTYNWSLLYSKNCVPPVTEAGTYFYPLFLITEVIPLQIRTSFIKTICFEFACFKLF